jgi:hypothetical protein
MSRAGAARGLASAGVHSFTTKELLLPEPAAEEG